MVLKIVWSDTRWDTIANKIGEYCTSLHYPWTRISKRRCGLTKPWRKILLKAQHSFSLWLMAQLANILARITLHKLLWLLKKIREVLRDALVDSEYFLTQIPSIRTDESGTPCPQIHLTLQQVPSITFTSEDTLRIICTIDPCTIQGTLPLPALRGSKSTPVCSKHYPKEIALFSWYLFPQAVNNDYYHIQLQC